MDPHLLTAQGPLLASNGHLHFTFSDSPFERASIISYFVKSSLPCIAITFLTVRPDRTMVAVAAKIKILVFITI